MNRDARTAAGNGRSRPARQPRAAPEEADKRANLAITAPTAPARREAGDAARAGAGAAAHHQAQRSEKTRRHAHTEREVRRTGTARQQRNPAEPGRLPQKEP